MALTPGTLSPADALRNRVKEAIKAEMQKSTGSLESDRIEPVPAVAVMGPKEEVVLQPNQKLFSGLMKIKPSQLPEGIRDFAVTVLDKEALPVEIKEFVPVHDEAYVMQLDQAAAGTVQTLLS